MTGGGLCRGYNDATIALNCGSMLRDALRDGRIVTRILDTALLEEFFQYVQARPPAAAAPPA